MRRPAVAGLFYPNRPDELDAELGRLVPGQATKTSARAMIVPHAGWTYSGRVAGEVYGRVTVPKLAVILGPNHFGRGPGASITCRGRWAFPGAEVPIAEDLARRIVAASSVLEEDETAHVGEHSIEVQLPFLRWVQPDISFVPIVLSHEALESCAEVGHAIATVLTTLPEPALVVCSTDLNHYEPQAVSNRKDRLAIDAILTLDPETVRSVVREHDISMCGLAPTMATLAALRELAHDRGELVRYETSGDVSGDYHRVVGYAGLIFPLAQKAAASPARTDRLESRRAR